MRPDSSEPKALPEVPDLLSRIGDWMASPSAPSRHPDEGHLALYLGWLLNGAPDPCPSPEAREHIGECPACYRMIEALQLVSLSAEREAAAEAVTLILTLAKRPGKSALAWASAAGETMRVLFQPPQTRLQSAPALMEMPLALISDAARRLPAEESESLLAMRLSVPAPAEWRPPDEEARLQAGPWQVRCAAWLEETGVRKVRVEVRGPDNPRPADGVAVRLRGGRGSLLAEGRTEAGMVTFSGLNARAYRIEIDSP